MYKPENWNLYLKKSDKELINIARTDFFRGSGRGGQKKNKTSNAVRLVIGDVIVTECGSRSRVTNLQKAVRKLRIGIALDYKKSFQFRKTQVLVPEKLMNYCSKGLIRINKRNQEYPLFLGFFINIFIAKQGDYREAAEFYQVSQSQLRKFIATDNNLIEKIKNIARLLRNETNDRQSQENNGGEITR